jgi:hypothetical protein
MRGWSRSQAETTVGNMEVPRPQSKVRQDAVCAAGSVAALALAVVAGLITFFALSVDAAPIAALASALSAVVGFVLGLLARMLALPGNTTGKIALAGVLGNALVGIFWLLALVAVGGAE